MDITFSFVIPVFNSKGYLNKCIDSIAKISNYTLHNIQIVLIDDGSYDYDAFLCDIYAKDEKVTVIHQLNHGVSVARNIGLLCASGDFIVFIDSDDAIDSEKMADCMEKIAADDSIDMLVYGLSFDYYHNDKLYKRENVSPALNGKFDRKLWLSHMVELFETNAISSLCTRIIRSKVLKENLLYLREDMTQYEDLELSIRCLLYCKQLYFKKDVLYFYRQEESTQKAKNRLCKIFNISSVVENIRVSLNRFTDNEISARDKEYILKTLYSNLAQELVNYVNFNRIKDVCQEYKSWKDNAFPEESVSNVFLSRLYEENVTWLLFHKYKIKVKAFFKYIVRATVKKMYVRGTD